MLNDGIDVGDGRHDNRGVNDGDNDRWIGAGGSDGACVDGCEVDVHVHVNCGVSHGRDHVVLGVQRYRLLKILMKMPAKTPKYV